MKFAFLIPLFLLLVGCVTPLSGSGAVPISTIMRVDDEMEGLPGTDTVRGLLLDASEGALMGADHKGRAAVWGRRCNLAITYTPLKATSICARAISMARASGDPVLLAMAWRRWGDVKRTSGDLDAAMSAYWKAISQPVPDFIPRALIFWSFTSLQLQQGAPGRAVQLARLARSFIEHEVKINPAHAEYLAIADWHLGRALLGLGSLDEAQVTLARALARQRKLVEENPEYAGYRFYLARILWAVSKLPDRAEAAVEARSILTTLAATDPARQDYQAALKEVQ